MFDKRYKLALALAFSLALQGCGGGTGGSFAGGPSSDSAPLLSAQPAALHRAVGENAQFSVVVTGAAPLAYQWQRNGVDVPGATGPTLNVTGLSVNDDGAGYSVRVSNAQGSVTSGVAALRISTESKSSYLAPPPPVSLSRPFPASGDTITVLAALPGATAINIAPVGEGCGTIRATSIAGSQVSITGAVGAVGNCIITADIRTASGVQTFTNEFTVVPRTVGGQGLSFNDGVYFSSGTFAGNPSNLLAINRVSVPQALITGGSGVVYLEVSDTSVSNKAVFTVEGVPGYYVVPGVVEAGRLRYNVDVSQSFMKAGAAPEERSITARLVGADGGLSAPVSASATALAVGTGPLQVALSFDKGDDLDLHVVTPGGAEVWYENKVEPSGGKLDLDVNASCVTIGANNAENIVWPAASTPAEGVYKVRVDFYQSCSGQPLNYTVKVVNCGVVTSFTGSFTAAQADLGRAGSGRDVASITHRSCSGFSVAGRATYDDYEVTALAGLSTTARALPIRLAKVEVRNRVGDTVLARGNTNENGDFDIPFAMTTPGLYYVAVLAEQNNAIVRQKVSNSAGVLYGIQSADLSTVTVSRTAAVAVHAPLNLGAQVFNIFDVGVSAFKEAKARVTAPLPDLKWIWTQGMITCGAAGTSCYRDSTNTIEVLSKPTDEDAYDDPVLAHEFGHFFMKKLSLEDSPGGAHIGPQYSNPRLAWSEGAATYFGQQVLRSTAYIDTTSTGVGGFNIEALPPELLKGTDDNTLTGKISEYTVAGVMWDMADAAQDSGTLGTLTVKDVVSNTDGVFASLVKMKARPDRGTVGPDLLDFLDAFLCAGYAVWGPAAGDNFRGLISTMHVFPYTPVGRPSCT